MMPRMAGSCQWSDRRGSRPADLEIGGPLEHDACPCRHRIRRRGRPVISNLGDEQHIAGERWMAARGIPLLRDSGLRTGTCLYCVHTSMRSMCRQPIGGARVGGRCSRPGARRSGSEAARDPGSMSLHNRAANCNFTHKKRSKAGLQTSPPGALSHIFARMAARSCSMQPGPDSHRRDAMPAPVRTAHLWAHHE